MMVKTKNSMVAHLKEINQLLNQLDGTNLQYIELTLIL